MQDSLTPEQPPSGPLYARESDATRESGAQDTRGPENVSEGRVGPIVTAEDSWAFQQWLHTGRIKCADCGTTVATENLASLPPHGCLKRQATPAGGSDA